MTKEGVTMFEFEFEVSKWKRGFWSVTDGNGSLFRMLQIFLLDCWLLLWVAVAVPVSSNENESFKVYIQKALK